MVTSGALKQMVLPGVLTVAMPVVVGLVFKQFNIGLKPWLPCCVSLSHEIIKPGKNFLYGSLLNCTALYMVNCGGKFIFFRRNPSWASLSSKRCDKSARRDSYVSKIKLLQFVCFRYVLAGIILNGVFLRRKLVELWVERYPHD
ncbi:hypothetical protein L0337_26290 [candidate division KSB1 bacterium]|nr:hypothetical protein [candidate division KSB1 bacterium]